MSDRTVAVSPNDNVTIECDHIVLGPIVDRQNRLYISYAVELNQMIEIPVTYQTNKINFKQLKNLLIEKKVRMLGMKPIKEDRLTEDQMVDDLDVIHNEMQRMREYGEKNNCQQTMDLFTNAPYKIFKMKDQESFEQYIDDIEKIIDRKEKEKTDEVAQEIRKFKFNF